MISNLFLPFKTCIAQNIFRAPAADLHHATIKTESPLQLRAGWQLSGPAALLQPCLSHSPETVFQREIVCVMTMSQSLVTARAESGEHPCWLCFRSKIIRGGGVGGVMAFWHLGDAFFIYCNYSFSTDI